MRSSAVAARRAAGVSPSSCRPSTPAHNADNSRKADYSFPRASRLTRGADLENVIRKGKRIRTAHLDVRALASPLDHPRVGFVVPKAQQTAVRRNRLKRQLRELVRLRLLRVLRVLPPLDVVIRAGRHTYDTPFATLGAEIDRVGANLTPARESC